jgi:hypothetical protein
MGTQNLPWVVMAFEAGSYGCPQHSLLLVLVFVAKENLMGLSIARTELSCAVASEPQKHPHSLSSVIELIHFGVFLQNCLLTKFNLLN